MSVYPSNIPTTSDLPDAGADLSSNPHSSLHDDVRDEVIAIAGELGVSPSGTASTVRARLDDGLGLRSIVYFTSSGTFTKATYPWLRAVRVRAQGGGGGGGGAETTAANENSQGGGGGGGGYAESFLLATALSSSVTVTVGAGGAGGSGANGSGGSASSFGAVTGSGGLGGLYVTNSTVGIVRPGGNGGTASNGDLNIQGDPGHYALTVFQSQTAPGNGGSSMLGGGGRADARNVSGDGAAGRNYGGGGAGAGNVNSEATARTGGAGAPGIVIVELYA